MSPLFPAKVTIDAQCFLERFPTEPYKQTMKFLSLLLRTIKITKTLNITIAFHESTLPKEIIDILIKSKFNVVTTKDYSDFSLFTDSETILVTKDKIFYQFLKSNENARILNIVNSEFVYYTASAMDIRFGYYYHKDFILWASSLPSKRLNFPGVFQANLRQANFFNRKIYHNNNQHRYYQRPTVFLPQSKKTSINFPEKLFYEYPIVNIKKFESLLSRKYGYLLPFLHRVLVTLERSRRSREFHLKPKS